MLMSINDNDGFVVRKFSEESFDLYDKVIIMDVQIQPTNIEKALNYLFQLEKHFTVEFKTNTLEENQVFPIKEKYNDCTLYHLDRTYDCSTGDDVLNIYLKCPISKNFK